MIPAQHTIALLTAESLTRNIDPASLPFADTSSLVSHVNFNDQQQSWIAQAEAKKAAELGLSIHQSGFNLLVLGGLGTGRTTLMLSAMHDAAKLALNEANLLDDLVALHQFDTNAKPLFLKIAAGFGTQLKQVFELFARGLAKNLASLLDEKDHAKAIATIQAYVALQLKDIHNQCAFIQQTPVLQEYLNQMQKDLADNFESCQPSINGEGDHPFEAMLNEGFLGRYRVNLLVSQAETGVSPVIYDQDPSLHSLFGGVESVADSNSTPEFLRLRAGNLLRADGGALLIHLRDILADEQNGAQILEKLHRFLRNGNLQIEDLSSSSNQGASFSQAQAAIPVNVKLVMIASHEDYYELLEIQADFFQYFPIKVEFVEKVKANAEQYLAYSVFIAQKCQQHQCQHARADAVAVLLQAMHRLEEDQTRMSTQMAVLEKLLLESAAVASMRNATLIEAQDVSAALQRRNARHGYIESHIRDTILDEELMINLHGEAIGQINGLTHVDLGEASFGSPVRISANCYAGFQSIITIDREVDMSGPTHNKGVMILKSWLHQHFAPLNPLNFTASLVFEQEYSGVDGDSASCAELFVLMSSLAQLPIKQGIAVTGAMNQHGEVLPVGGLNEKIEGYFRVCQQVGLNGEQGVLIPARNVRHLMLNDDVLNAVREGRFTIVTMGHVNEGMAFLMNQSIHDINHFAEATLASFKGTLEMNMPTKAVRMDH